MAIKVKNDNLVSTYDLRLPHLDIVDMMNDPHVLIEGGNVANNQVFEIIVRKSNGTEVSFNKTVDPTDTLIIRYKKVIITEVANNLGDVDVLPVTWDMLFLVFSVVLFLYFVECYVFLTQNNPHSVLNNINHYISNDYPIKTKESNKNTNWEKEGF